MKVCGIDIEDDLYMKKIVRSFNYILGLFSHLF